MNEMLTSALPYVAMILGPTGGAYIGLKVALNGTKADIAEIKGDLATVKKDVGELKESAAYARGRESAKGR